MYLITEKAETLHIPSSETVEIDRLAEDGKNEKYYFDIDWYLSHGYVKLEDAIKRIEGRYRDLSNK